MGQDPGAKSHICRFQDQPTELVVKLNSTGLFSGDSIAMRRPSFLFAESLVLIIQWTAHHRHANAVAFDDTGVRWWCCALAILLGL